MYLPNQEHLTQIDADDPLPYYFAPLTRRIYRARLEAALSLLDDGKPGLCLEIGFGSGILLPELARRYPRLAALDFHRRGSVVKQMLRQEGLSVPLLAGDIGRLPLAGGSCETVLCLSVMEHLDQPALQSAAREVARVLRPGGIAVVGFPVRNTFTDAWFRLAGYAPRDLHPSGHMEIAAAVSGCLSLDEWRTVPAGVPRVLASYWVCRAKRV